MASPSFGFLRNRDDVRRAAVYFDIIATACMWCADALRENGFPRVTTVLQDIDPLVFHPGAAEKEWFEDNLLERYPLNSQAYHYGIALAARLAGALRMDRICVIEFGVGGGNGLIEMERHATTIEAEAKIDIEVFGFDLETGLPPPRDYRDLPYNWKAGFFRMDRGALEKRLQKSKLVLGDISETVSRFTAEHDPPPVGFCSIDVDFYSSTKEALKLFDADARRLLPRTFLYFDDVVGDHDEIHCEHVGELLAIKEFNAFHLNRKIEKINGLSYKFGQLSQWHDCFYVLHIFDHPEYNTYVRKNNDWQLPLK